MIKAVTVTNHKSESLRMELAYPEKSGMLIYNIDGIGAGKAVIQSTDYATSDGAKYNSARVEARNIVLSIKLMAKPTVEDMRHESYRYFPLKKKIRLTFETDSRTVYIDGYVESNEPVIFSSQEYTQISIMCPDPYFNLAGEPITVFAGVDPQFEFPLINDSLTENLIEFGHVMIDTRAIIDYQGEVDTGLLIQLHFLGDAENLRIFNVATRDVFTIYTDKIQAIVGSPLRRYDDIYINTKKGEKSIRLLRDGKYTNIIGAIDKNSVWLDLTYGDNTFLFEADSGEHNVIATFSYSTRYGGV